MLAGEQARLAAEGSRQEARRAAQDARAPNSPRASARCSTRTPTRSPRTSSTSSTCKRRWPTTRWRKSSCAPAFAATRRRRCSTSTAPRCRSASASRRLLYVMMFGGDFELPDEAGRRRRRRRARLLRAEHLSEEPRRQAPHQDHAGVPGQPRHDADLRRKRHVDRNGAAARRPGNRARRRSSSPKSSR